jgi:hypothetical protein
VKESELMAGTHYFGDYWPSGLCDGGTRVPAPIGQKCLHCEIAITEYDRGSFVEAMVPVNGKFQRQKLPLHRECGIRILLGSPRHIRKECTCYQVADDPCESESSASTPEGKRAEAIESWQLFMQQAKP